MGIIFIIVLFTILKNTSEDRRKSDIFKYIIPGIIGFSVISTVFPVLSFFGGIGLLVYLTQKYKNNNMARKRQQQFANANYGPYYGGTFQAPPMPRAPLPQSIKKRRKIISNFNEKYGLCLTDEQIYSISNASYMSEIWRNELAAMDHKYEVVYEWLAGGMSWLRTYMYVFRVQDIISDIVEQERICAYAFNELFYYADSLGDVPMYMKVRAINDKYYTNFDENTYMIAYRFLQQKGFDHKTANPDIVSAEENLDDILDKYRVMPGNGKKF